jgi:hypothetical protein
MRSHKGRLGPCGGSAGFRDDHCVLLTPDGLDLRPERATQLVQNRICSTDRYSRSRATAGHGDPGVLFRTLLPRSFMIQGFPSPTFGLNKVPSPR